ncbi:myrosinase 1-like isoform X2 [Ostrinia furnacalis]|uniref:myrosinase 1-like isoform X2 n=1 Tax=Ostrinia furnacalis TaxID=93504 RepID=UPI00103A6D90|nr:myrosinase 1-like isoform X2 [Ostrinia furnacalis]
MKCLVSEMIGVQLVVFSVVAAGLEARLLEFPPGFKFGAATASYQIEGAWNASDKTANIWDEFTHKHRDRVKDGSNGDVACDSYHQWERDVEMAAELGLDFYRFSLSWTRLLPTGFGHAVSEDGKTYYNKLIDALLAKGIEPVVTLYHWDMPQRFQDLGGWANPLVVDWFAAYARVAFDLYADRVKTWITINEPVIVCDASYSGFLAPAVRDDEVGVYLCNKNILLAHAKAWRIYDVEFRPKYKGQISWSNHLVWFEPASKAEKEMTALAMEHCAGRYSHPIFSKQGGWPPALEKFIAEKSIKEGFRRSRLPAFTNEEIELIRGTYDFYGLNHYTSKVVRLPRPGETPTGWPLYGSPELGVILEARPQWKPTSCSWLKQNPKGFRNLLVWLKEQYGDQKFLVTENGFPTTGSNLDDTERVQFYKDYLTQMLLAMKKDNVNVVGYTAWSLMDNFEWVDGYSNKFGLYEVNFTDPERPRVPRRSATFYADVIKNRALDEYEDRTAYVAWVVIGSLLVFVTVAAVLYKYIKRIRDKRKPEYESVALHNNTTPKSFLTQ